MIGSVCAMTGGVWNPQFSPIRAAPAQVGTSSPVMTTTSSRSSVQLGMGALLHHSPDGLVALDRHGVVRCVNLAAAALVGRPAESLPGQPFADLFARDDQRLATELLQKLVASASGESQETLGVATEADAGRILDVVIRDCRDDSTVDGFIVTFRDATSRTKRERDLRHRVAHDLLTGAASRGEFLERLDAAVADPRGADRLGLLFVDVDHFKAVNDCCGHHVGDRTLVAVSRLIERSVRDGDVVARFGGDEFVALLRNVQTVDDLVDAGERLAASIRANGQVDQEVMAVTVSVGGALNCGDDAAGLLRRADHAMLRAKELGRGRVVVDRPDDES